MVTFANIKLQIGFFVGRVCKSEIAESIKLDMDIGLKCIKILVNNIDSDTP